MVGDLWRKLLLKGPVIAIGLVPACLVLSLLFLLLLAFQFTFCGDLWSNSELVGRPGKHRVTLSRTLLHHSRFFV